MNEETVTISKKYYEQLKRNSEFLRNLLEYGVDNWSGYYDAVMDYNRYLKGLVKEE